MFLKEVFSAPQGCIYMIKKNKQTKNIIIAKYYYNLKRLFSL